MKRKVLLFLLTILYVLQAGFLLENFSGYYRVEASDVVFIHIKEDGTVDPSTSLISRNGDLYTLTNRVNVTSDYDIGILIERDHIVFDGAHFALERESGFVDGIKILSADNVTIKNLTIDGFMDAISLDGSRECKIINNNITGLFCISISDYSSGNYVAENYIIDGGIGVLITSSYSNTVIENNIISNGNGIMLESHSYNNSILQNNITDNNTGVYLREIGSLTPSNNHIYHNNFMNNAIQVEAPLDSANNYWDNGTFGGNFWSDYNLRYPEANEQDDTGIWDTDYFIDAQNQDRYPLVEIIPESFPIPILLVSLLLAFVIHRSNRAR